MKKLESKYNILLISLFAALVGMMSIRVRAAELELEVKTCRDNNPFEFAISDTWTSEGQTIHSYDVSEEGQIAIVFSNQTIGVFDNDMSFLYQLSYKNNGASGVLWLDESHLFIDHRSNTAVAFGKDGLAECFYEITGPNNYYYEVVTDRLRKQGDDQYFCIKSGGSNNSLIHYGYYTMLKRTSDQGCEEILYETNVAFNWAFVFRCGIFAFMFIVQVLLAFGIRIYSQRTNKNDA